MVHRASLLVLNRLLPLVIVLSFAAPARAEIIALTAADLAGITPITFAGLANGTPVNGLTVGGVQFHYLVNNLPSAGAIIGTGPGTTLNVAPPDLENISGNAGAVLRLTFGAPEVRLGYGFALNIPLGTVQSATTVSLFNASNALVGTLSANGLPDPIFAGGFIGLQSTLPFKFADVTFSPSGTAFAFDNLRVAPAAVPEPASLMLVGIAIAGAWARLRKQVARIG